MAHANARSIKRQRDKAVAAEARITVTLGELLGSAEALTVLVSQPLPAPRAFTLAKIAKAVQAELALCNETRVKILDQHGTKKEDGTSYSFESDEKREAWEKEWMDLIATPVSISGETIKISTLGGVTISAQAMLALSWLIVEG